MEKITDVVRIIAGRAILAVIHFNPFIAWILGNLKIGTNQFFYHPDLFKLNFKQHSKFCKGMIGCHLYFHYHAQIFLPVLTLLYEMTLHQLFTLFTCYRTDTLSSKDCDFRKRMIANLTLFAFFNIMLFIIFCDPFKENRNFKRNICIILYIR